MNSLLAAPSETISPGQEVLRYFESGQHRRPDLRVVHSASPNASVEEIIATDSNTSTRAAVDRLVTSTIESLWNLPIDAAEELSSFQSLFQRLTEGVTNAPRGNVFIPPLLTGLAGALPVETLADRSRAVVYRLTRLNAGWDGYDGVPVLSGVAEQALRLLEAIGAHTQIAPDVVPLSDGGLQLEWYVGDHEIEVEIDLDCTMRLHHECTADGRTAELPIDAPLDMEVAAFFRALNR
ncbi:MAG: hypothetical protein OXF88_08930 [Rhodobacteraceae bacterium]|nr:hypothetical protein [Paracoccaceae bacterium]MCY4139823.1 hypothetical protein [Paracoccaceae bacterium]